MLVFIFGFVGSLQTRKAAADVLAHLLYKVRLLIAVTILSVGMSALSLVLLQLPETDFGRAGIKSTGPRASRAKWLMGQLPRGETIRQLLLGLPMRLLYGLHLTVHPLHHLLRSALFIRLVAAHARARQRHSCLPSHLLESTDQRGKQSDLSFIALIRVLVIHYLDNLPKILVSLQFLPLKVEIVAEFAKAHWAESEWLLVGLIQLR